MYRLHVGVPSSAGLYAHYEAYGKCMLPFLRVLRGLLRSFYKKCENSLPMFPGESCGKAGGASQSPRRLLFFLESLLDYTPSSHRDYQHIERESIC